MGSGQTRGKYTAEFKFEVVRQVMAGQAISVVSKVLNIPKARLSNLVRQGGQGSLSGDGDKPSVVVTPEQMELARLRAEVARLRIERDIAKKAAYFEQDTLRGTPRAAAAQIPRRARPLWPSSSFECKWCANSRSGSAAHANCSR